MSNSKMNNDRIAQLVFLKVAVLFGANRINIRKSSKGVIDAIVGWPDQGQLHYDESDEQQEVIWNYGILNPDVSLVLEYIDGASLMRGDRIDQPRGVVESQLCQAFNWSGDRVRSAVDELLQIRIDMVDGGARTDSFFLHF